MRRSQTGSGEGAGYGSKLRAAQLSLWRRRTSLSLPRYAGAPKSRAAEKILATWMLPFFESGPRNLRASVVATPPPEGSRLGELHRHGRGFATADAQRGDSSAQLAGPQRVQQRHENAR